MKIHGALFGCLIISSSCCFGQLKLRAEGSYASYDLHVTKYSTLDDAYAGTNAVGSYTLVDPETNDRRDLLFQYAQNVEPFGYYASMIPAYDYNSTGIIGDGNPNNSSVGWVSRVAAAPYTGQEVMTGGWTDLQPGIVDGSSFSFTVASSGGNQANNFSLLWHGNPTNVSKATLVGRHISSYINMNVTGLTANWDNLFGIYMSQDHPTTVTGSLGGIFENTNSVDPQYHGFYVYQGSINETTWAYPLRHTFTDPFVDSIFGAVPEPATMTVLGLAALVGLRKRNKKS